MDNETVEDWDHERVCEFLEQLPRSVYLPMIRYVDGLRSDGGLQELITLRADVEHFKTMASAHLRMAERLAVTHDDTRAALERAMDALRRIHDREWDSGDVLAGAHHAAEMWGISDEALQPPPSIDGTATAAARSTQKQG